MSRRRAIGFAVAGLVIVLAVGIWVWVQLGGGRSDVVSAPTTARVEGPTPIDTALALSREGWKSAEAVVVISEQDAAAAAVSGPLAAAAGGPVLLTESDRLTEAVAGRIRELGAKRIYVVGETGGISDAVISDAKKIVETESLVRVDEYQMADAVALAITELDDPGGAVVVPGDAPDVGVVVSGLAAAYRMPVLFAKASGEVRLSNKSVNALRGGRLLVVASESDISDAAVAQAGLPTDVVDRLPADEGIERFAAAFAEYAFGRGFEYRTVFAARDSDVAHAYALAPLAAQPGLLSPLLVTADDELGADSERFFVDHASSIERVRFLGPGGKSADAVETAARRAAETRISRDAVVVRDSLLESMSRYEPGTVVFADTPAVRGALKKGRFLVAGPSPHAANGFIVRVDAIESAGGQVTARVSQASLDDVVIKGSFDVRLGSYVATDSATQTGASNEAPGPRIMPAAYRPGGQPARLVRVARVGERKTKVGRLIFTVPYDTGEISQNKEVWSSPDPPQGAAQPKGKFKVKVGASAQTSGQVTITLIASATWQEESTPAGGFRDLIGIKTHGRLTRFFMQSVTELESKVSLEAGASFVAGKAKFEPWTTIEPTPLEKQLKLQGVPIGQTVVFIGVVPIHLSSDAEPVGKFDGTFAAKLSFDASSKRSYATQFMYDADATEHFTYEATQRKTPPEWAVSLKGSATGRAGAGARVNLKIDGIIGPYVQALAYGKAVAKGSLGVESRGGNPPVLTGAGEFALKAGLEPSVGGTLEVLGTTLGETSWKPSNEFIEKYLEWTIWNPKIEGTLPVGGDDKQDDDSKKAAARQSYDIVMVVDNSGSMEYEAAPGVPRFKNAQAAATGLLDAVSEPSAGIANKVGFASYASGIGESQPLTDDYDEVEAASLRLIPAGGTNMEAGLNAGIDHLQFGEARKRVLILVSDGAANTGASTFEELSAPGGVLERAKSSDIQVWAIGYGSDDGGEWNPELLRQIAQYTGGEAFIEEPVDDVGNRLALRMVGITERAAGAKVVVEKSTTLDPGQTAELTRFTVSDRQVGKTVQARVLVGANKEDADIWLVDPDGVEVVPGLYQGAEVTQGKAVKRFVVPNAKAGEYRVYATPPAATMAGSSSLRPGATEQANEDAGSNDGSKSELGADSAVADPSADGSGEDAATQDGEADGTEGVEPAPGAYVVVSETQSDGEPRGSESLTEVPATVLPAWFWPSLGGVAITLLGLLVLSLFLRKTV